MTDSPTRRRYLRAGCTFLSAALAGCTDGPSADTQGEPEETPGTADQLGTTADRDLDLREANVVDVSIEDRDGVYRFDVTLIHDDDGEDGYANWWQVETRAGESLGRRELLHGHGTQEFTRSMTISIPDDVTEVVVRGHDQIHGYGGQAMLVTLPQGETQAVKQGSEPDSFSE
jgi:hypothetical protein